MRVQEWRDKREYPRQGTQVQPMKRYVFTYRIKEVAPFIDWSYFLHAWGIAKESAQAVEIIAEAKAMLARLSGQTHEVYTAVCFTWLDPTPAEGAQPHEVTQLAQSAHHSFVDCTKVTFKTLSEEEINYYVTKYHPLDKAGAYGVQEWIGYVGVTKMEGSYFNVMGFPICRVYETLRQLISKD